MKVPLGKKIKNLKLGGPILHILGFSLAERCLNEITISGLDLDCGPFLAIHTEAAVNRGFLSEIDVNNALANTITVQMRLGMFDGEPSAQPFGNLGPRDVCTPNHQQLALEAARQGIVLLQNHGGTLPLSTARHRTVAVIGPNSDVTVTMIGNYAGRPSQTSSFSFLIIQLLGWPCLSSEKKIYIF